MCSEKPHSFKVAPKDQRLYGIGRRTAAVSIHMCVWQNHMSTQGLHRGSKRYKSWADQILLRPGAAASAHTHTHVCVSEKTPFIQGCTQGSKVVWGRPTNCCCKHTHVCGRITCQLKACTKDQEGTRVWPNNCRCKHTHMCAAEKKGG